MRVGDPRLLTGTATYVGNLELPGMLEAHFVLSTMAHARVTRVDVESARQVPGVIDIVLNALAIEFIVQLDETVADHWDKDRRIIRAGACELVIKDHLDLDDLDKLKV